jgi:hypothetical protein
MMAVASSQFGFENTSVNDDKFSKDTTHRSWIRAQKVSPSFYARREYSHFYLPKILDVQLFYSNHTFGTTTTHDDVKNAENGEDYWP